MNIDRPQARSLLSSSLDPLVSHAPLSFQQQYYLSAARRYDIENGFMRYAVRITGALHVDLLQASIDMLLRRHSALRTKIGVIDGNPVQQIHAPVEYRLPIVRLDSVLSEAELEDNARGLVEAFFRNAVNFEDNSLFQANLIEINSKDHILAVAIHHIIFDGMSSTILFKELWSIYGDLVQMRKPLLKAPRQQYADYAVWQKATQATDVERQDAYWKRRLIGASPVHLPHDESPENTTPYSFSSFRIEFGKQTSSALDVAARRNKTLRAMVMLAVYSAILARWSGTKDLLIPFVITGRHRPAHVNMIGMLAQPLLLRIELHEATTFDKVLTAVTKEFSSAWKHLDYGRVANDSLDLMEGCGLQWASWSSKELTGAQTPSDWRESSEYPTIAPFSFKYFTQNNVRTELDHSILFLDDECQLSAFVFYRADLFHPTTMQRFGQDLQTLTEEVTTESSGAFPV